MQNNGVEGAAAPGETTGATTAKGLIFPRQLTPELGEILGLMPWITGNIAAALRAAGAEIPRKCEAEQAFVMHWLTTLALEHGPAWRRVAGDELGRAAELLKAIT
jgi:hypothetical protein